MKAISESETVILAYGAYAKRPVVVERSASDGNVKTT